MELRDLRTFAAVARLLSFHRAAAELNAAQSTVSARIAALETELGVRLFERLGRRVALTDAGERLVQYAAKLIDVEDEARAWVTGESRLRGLLTVRVPESLCAYRLPPVIAAFRRRHPEVALHLTACTLNGLEKDLRQGITDLAFVMTDSVRGSDLVVEALGVEPLVLVAAPHHPLAGREALSARDLNGATLVLSTADCSYRAVIEDALAAEGVQLAAGLEFSSAAALRGCVASGVGVTLLPGVAVRDELHAGTLRALAWTDQPFETAVLMVRHKGKWVSPYMDTFMELCRAAYADTAGEGARVSGAWNFPCPMADVATILVPASASPEAAHVACCGGGQRPAAPGDAGTLATTPETDDSTPTATNHAPEAATVPDVHPSPPADAVPMAGDEDQAPEDAESAAPEGHAGYGGDEASRPGFPDDVRDDVRTDDVGDDAWDYPETACSDAVGVAAFTDPDADMMATAPDMFLPDTSVPHASAPDTPVPHASVPDDTSFEASGMGPETVWGNAMDMEPDFDPGMAHAGPDHMADDRMDADAGSVPPYMHEDPAFDASPREHPAAAPDAGNEAALHAAPQAAPEIEPGRGPSAGLPDAPSAPSALEEDRHPSLRDTPEQETSEPEPPAFPPTTSGNSPEEVLTDAPAPAPEQPQAQPDASPAAPTGRPAAAQRTPDPAPESAQWLSLLPPKR
jgi:DNA-binding transcriptional LysR family regulator